MSELHEDRTQERRWAQTRFRPFLLGQLSQDDAERVAETVAIFSGMADELDGVEQELIEAYLDRRLNPVERSAFESQYVNGHPDNLAKLHLQEALRSPELKNHLEQARPVETPRPFLVNWRTVAVAAAIVAVFFAALYALENRKLAGVLEAINGKKNPAPQVVPPNQNVEQPAGLDSSGALLLPASPGPLTLRIEKAPARLSWAVPDYQQQYRFRIFPSNGREISSPPLASKNNAVEYALPSSGSLSLPWEVFILAGDGPAIFAHYTLKP